MYGPYSYGSRDVLAINMTYKPCTCLSGLHENEHSESLVTSQVQLIALSPIKCRVDLVAIPIPDQLWRLLIYLNESAGRAIRRQEICALLWDSNNSQKTRHSLSQLLYVAKKKFPGVSIVSTEDALQLTHRLPTDIDELVKAIKDADYTRIAALYHGDFLVGESENTSPTFEQWRSQKAASIHNWVIRAYREGVKRSFSEMAWERCVYLSDLLANLDSLDATSQTMARDAEIALQSPLVPEPTNHKPSKFVGRKGELNELRSLYDLASALTETSIIAIMGESGVGKTRLATHFGRAVALQGDSVLMTTCFEAEQHVPFAPVVRLLENVPSSKIHTLPRRMRSALAALHPRFLDEITGELEEHLVPSKTFLFESICAAARIASAHRKCLLIVDDVQWCDEASSEWLHHFHRSQADSAKVILVTARSDVPHAMGHYRWATTSEHSHVLELDGLSSQESAALLMDCLTRNQTNVEATQINRIQELCSGNPLYIVAMADSVARGDEHNLVDGNALRIPDAIHRLISHRIQRLSGHARQLAETLACITDEVSVSELASYADLSISHVLEAGRELEEAQLIRKTDLLFQHDLIKRSIYEGMSEFAKRSRHERIYRTTQMTSRASRARHALHAGLRHETYVESVSAGHEAIKIHAYLEAVHHYETALHVAVTDSDRYAAAINLIQLLNNLKWHRKASELAKETKRWCMKHNNQAALVLCDLTIINSELAVGKHPAAEFFNRIQSLIDTAANCGSPLYTMQALRLAIFVAHLIGDEERLDDIFRHVEKIRNHLDTASQAELLAAMSSAVAPKDRKRAIELSNKALHLASVIADPRIQVIVLGHRGSIHTLYGEVERALEYFDRAEDACTDAALSDLLVYVYANRACILYDQGRFSEGHMQNAKAMECASHVPLVPLLNRAVAYLDENQYEEAISWATKTLQANSQLNVSWVEMGASTIRGLAFLGVGDLKQAEKEGDKVVKIMEMAESATTDMSYTTILLSSLDKARGELCSAIVRLEQAMRKQHVDPFAMCRMEIALSNLIAETDRDRAYALAKAALVRAKTVNSVLLQSKATDLLEELR